MIDFPKEKEDPATVDSSAILKNALHVIMEREAQHGHKRDNLERIAEFWSAYLGVTIDPWQVADMMELLKVARRCSGAFNMDDYVDGAGYAALAGEARGWK